MNITNTSVLVTLLQIAGLLHLGLVWAGVTMPKTVGLSGHLAVLPPFIRRLFYVYYAYIGVIIVAFGLMTFFYAGPMVEGQPVARGLCFLMAFFWIARLAAAVLIFDVRPYLQGWFLRLGYAGLNLVFVYFVLLYALVAWLGGAR